MRRRSSLGLSGVLICGALTVPACGGDDNGATGTPEREPRIPRPPSRPCPTTADGGVRPGAPMDAGTAQTIVDYLRSLPVVRNAVPDTTCPTPGDAGDAGDAAPE